MHFVGNVQIEIAIKSFHTICNNDNNKNKLHLEISLNCQLSFQNLHFCCCFPDCGTRPDLRALSWMSCCSGEKSARWRPVTFTSSPVLANSAQSFITALLNSFSSMR